MIESGLGIWALSYRRQYLSGPGVVFSIPEWSELFSDRAAGQRGCNCL